MYNSPQHIASSYNINDVGESIYNVVRNLKPKKIIDFGILYGYSTVCLAQAVRDNGIGHIYALDLFEDYQYRHSIKNIVEHNLQYYDLTQYVTLIKKDFKDWLAEEEDFDLLHLDVSNTGDVINSLYEKYPKESVIFEGGTVERDNVKWMIEYNATPIKHSITPYKIINNNFPGLSGYNI